jgi:hypothetical protein
MDSEVVARHGNGAAFLPPNSVEFVRIAVGVHATPSATFVDDGANRVSDDTIMYC